MRLLGLEMATFCGFESFSGHGALLSRDGIGVITLGAAQGKIVLKTVRRGL